MGDARAYVCASFRDGAACHNAIRVSRVHAEDVLLKPLRDGLLAPEHVERMAAEMETYFAERLRQRAARAADAPKELRELEARIGRLRDRLERGDPDLTGDELLAAIERAKASGANCCGTCPMRR
jgi:hypothetical protein